MNGGKEEREHWSDASGQPELKRRSRSFPGMREKTEKGEAEEVRSAPQPSSARRVDPRRSTHDSLTSPSPQTTTFPTAEMILKSRNSSSSSPPTSSFCPKKAIIRSFSLKRRSTSDSTNSSSSSSTSSSSSRHQEGSAHSTTPSSRRCTLPLTPPKPKPLPLPTIELLVLSPPPPPPKQRRPFFSPPISTTSSPKLKRSSSSHMKESIAEQREEEEDEVWRRAHQVRRTSTPLPLNPRSPGLRGAELKIGGWVGLT